MAVGKRGQNIRLASELTGFELDMYNAEEYEPFLAKLQEIQRTQIDFFRKKKSGTKECFL